MKNFSFSPATHMSLTFACIAAAQEAGLSVTLSGYNIPMQLKSSGGFLHIESCREKKNFFIYQNGKPIGFHQIDGLEIVYGEHKRLGTLDKMIEIFSQKSVEDFIYEENRKIIEEIMATGDWDCQDPYMKNLVMGLYIQI